MRSVPQSVLAPRSQLGIADLERSLDLRAAVDSISDDEWFDRHECSMLGGQFALACPSVISRLYKP